MSETATPLGYAQYTVSNVAKTFASNPVSGKVAPKGTIRAEVIAEQAIRYTLDGTTPTASLGNPLPAGAQYIVTTNPNLFSFISQAGTATVNVEFLGY